MDNTFKISMPHRHTVIYEDEECILSFEVEQAVDGIIFYSISPTVLKGGIDNFSIPALHVEKWLRDHFSNIEIYFTPPVA